MGLKDDTLRKAGDTPFAAQSAGLPRRGPGATSAFGLRYWHPWFKISTVVGVAAAVVLAVLVNVIGARHFHRWDATTGGLYTLSEATRETLHKLEEPLVVHILVPEGDALHESLEQMLLAYRAESPKLDVRSTDPDRSPAEFLAVRQKYGIALGRSEDGRVVTDAAVVVARAGKPYFITPGDLVEVDAGGGERMRPRLEQALTSAIRRSLGDDRPRVCFTEGHGERSVDVAGEDGLAVLKDRLAKNNYEVVSIWTDGEPVAAPLDGCRLAIVAAPALPFPETHVDALRSFVERGGSMLFVAGPVPREDDKGYVELGDERLLELAGVKRATDFVFEVDPARRATHGFGETFLPEVLPHAITAALVKDREKQRGGEVVLTVASSLEDLRRPDVTPQRLLQTTDRAFGMIDFFAWAKEPNEPTKKPGDIEGPLAIAVAAERKPAKDGERGARIVIVASASVLSPANWREPELHATASFVESTISWLASHRAFLDIPSKPTVMTSLDLTAEGLSIMFRACVIYVPLAVAVGGIAVAFARRRERTSGSRNPAPTSPEPPTRGPTPEAQALRPEASRKKQKKGARS